jgi:hypothetical protein
MNIPEGQDAYEARQAKDGVPEWYVIEASGVVLMSIGGYAIHMYHEQHARDFAKMLSLARRVREDEDKRAVFAGIGK